MADAVRLEGITKRFGKTVAVDHVSLVAEKGEFLTLIGPSGCGKTTTLRVVAGLTDPDEGTVYFNGTNVTDLPAYKRDMGMVFQNYALFPHMNVYGNVAFGLKMKKLCSSKSETTRRVEEALGAVRLLGFETRHPHELSGGQQQRIALARCLVTHPSLLLLDEPLSNLDAKLREEMRVELKLLQRKIGITTIFVTHDQAEALVMSDRLVVMNRGKVESVGSPSDMYEKPQTPFVSEFIGKAIFFDGVLTATDSSVSTGEGLVVSIADHTGFVDGDKLRVVARPQRIRFVGAEESCANKFSGTVEFLTYIGNIVQYIVRLDKGPTVVLEYPNTYGKPEKSIGDRVHVALEPKDLVVVRLD